jgi:hypothetical protein
MRNLNQLKAEIQSSGHFFSVRFIKKDGTERFLRGRFGVHKFVKGGVSTLKNDNWNFFDVNDGYRSVKPDTIKEVVFNHERYVFNEN